MYFHKCWFLVLVVGMLWSSTSAAKDGNDLGSGEADECRVATGGLEKSLISALADCILPLNASLPRLSASDGEEQHRAFARTFCSTLPYARSCFSRESGRWARCWNQTLSSLFQVSRELVETTLEAVCQEQGEELAVLLHGWHLHTLTFTASNPILRECLVFGSIKLKVAQTSRAGLPSKLWYVHHELQSFRDCLFRNTPAGSDFTRLAERRIDALLGTMKCLHPEDESVALCKDIDAGLIDRAGLCPIKTRSELMLPLSLVVEQRASSCFVIQDPYSAKLSDASTLQDFGEYFKKYCRRQDRIKYCLSETALAAEVCLEDDAFEIFQLIRFYLESLLEAGCFEEGRRVATVLHTEYVIKSSANQSEPLRSCMEDAVGARVKAVDDPSRLYSQYQELSQVRKCLLKRVEGDAAYDASVNEFIQEVQDSMKCFDPQDKSVVLCKSIASD